MLLTYYENSEAFIDHVAPNRGDPERVAFMEKLTASYGNAT
jgi:hypothetical protein